MFFLKNRFLIIIIGFLLIVISFIFIKKQKEKENKVKKKGKAIVKFNEIQDKLERVEFDTISLETNKESRELIDTKKERILNTPINLKNQIERIVLKILFEEKSVRSLKILIEAVLERAVNEKITISEKIINTIINQMNRESKIQFTQRVGWKIRI